MNALATQSNAFIQHPEAIPARLCVTSGHDTLGMDLVAHGQGGVCVPSDRVDHQPLDGQPHAACNFARVYVAEIAGRDTKTDRTVWRTNCNG